MLNENLVSNLGLLTDTEIMSQPESWRNAASMSTLESNALPKKGEAVLVLGCGTSYYLGATYAALRENAGAGITDAAIASDFKPVGRHYDRVIAISRSGTSMDLIEALQRLGGKFPVTAILGELGTPIAALASEVIDFSFADEKSLVQTRFPTSILTFLRAHLGMKAADLDSLSTAAESVFELNLLDAPARQLVILGTDWASFMAHEAALKCRESAGIWVESYSSGEFRHGPISVANEGSLIWAMSPLSEDESAAIRSTGAQLHQGKFDPQVELVFIQRHAVEWARRLGRNADLPVHLARSVV